MAALGISIWFTCLSVCECGVEIWDFHVFGLLNFQKLLASTHASNVFTLVLVFLCDDSKTRQKFSNNLFMYLWGCFWCLFSSLLPYLLHMIFHRVTWILLFFVIEFWWRMKAPTGAFRSKLTKAHNFGRFKRDSAACLTWFRSEKLMFFVIFHTIVFSWWRHFHL